MGHRRCRLQSPPVVDAPVGNDCDDVRAGPAVAGVPLKLACTPRIEVMSMQTEGPSPRWPLPLAQLPAELVQACRVQAEARGLHKPFLREAACGQVYAAAVGPMVGKVLAFKRTQACEIQAGGTAVFKGMFLVQRVGACGPGCGPRSRPAGRSARAARERPPVASGAALCQVVLQLVHDHQ
jgi:hypothetical protein